MQQAITTVHMYKKTALQDAEARPLKRIWRDRGWGFWAIGDKDDLPDTITTGSPVHCDWEEISLMELEGRE